MTLMSVIQTTEGITLCPESVMLTHHPVTLTNNERGKDQKVVYNLIWHQSVYYGSLRY